MTCQECGYDHVAIDAEMAHLRAEVRRLEAIVAMVASELEDEDTDIRAVAR